jgi:hypothetical protein
MGPEVPLEDLLEQQEALQQQQLQQLRQRSGLATGLELEPACIDGGMGLLAGSLRSLKLIGCDDVDIGLGLLKLTALTQLEVVSPGADLSINLLVEVRGLWGVATGGGGWGGVGGKVAGWKAVVGWGLSTHWWLMLL